MQVVEANGKTFEFEDSATPDQIGAALDEHFARESRIDLLNQPFDPHSETSGQDPRAGAIAQTNRLRDFITGDSKKTEQIDGLQEVALAPELNELSLDALKSSLGLLATSETASIEDILAKQFGDQISFDEDEKGNVIASLPSGNYVLNRPGLSGSDATKFIVDMLAFGKASKANSVKGAVAGSAATEAGMEGVETALGGDFDAANVLAAGAMDGSFKGLEKVIGAGYRAVKGSAESSVVDGARDAGISTVMTSDVRPPDTFVGKTLQQVSEKIPVIGTGAIRQDQQQQRIDAVQNIADKYSQFSYESIVQSLRSQSNRVKNAAGNVLSSVGSKLDDVGEIPTGKTNEAIQSALSDLSRPGVIKSEAASADLTVLMQALSESPQTFTTLKENRTAFRDIVNSVDRADRSQLTSRAKALLTNVQSAMREDMTSFARQNLTPKEFGQWQRANAVYAQEAEKLTKTRLKNILDKGEMTPEAVEGMLFSAKPSEVRSLYNGLTPEGRSNARAAIIQKVVRTLNDRQSGFTPNSFASEMKKHGMRTDIFFRGEEKKALGGLLKALDYTRRSQDAAVSTPTGQQLLGAIFTGGAILEPGATATAASTLSAGARAYESSVVRDVLLRLDSIPPGSSEFEKTVRRLLSYTTPTAQAARESQTE